MAQPRQRTVRAPLRATSKATTLPSSTQHTAHSNAPISMAFFKQSNAVRTNIRESASTLPMKKVSLRSACMPWTNTVTSRLMMSPSSITRSSGMPWQMTSFAELQAAGNVGHAPTSSGHRSDVHADRFGEEVVVQRRWVRVTLDAGFVHNFVNVIACHASPQRLTRGVHDFASNLVHACRISGRALCCTPASKREHRTLPAARARSISSALSTLILWPCAASSSADEPSTGGIHGGGATSATRPTRMQPGSVRRAARTALGIVRAGDVGRDGHLAGHLAWAQWPSELEAVELACHAARSNTAVSAQYCTILRHWHNTEREQAYRPFFLLPLTACCSSAFLNILCRALCCAQLPLKHSCEQKKDPGMPSFLHLGHTILPGLVHPSDMQVGNSFFDSAMVTGGEQPTKGKRGFGHATCGSVMIEGARQQNVGKHAEKHYHQCVV